MRGRVVVSALCAIAVLSGPVVAYAAGDREAVGDIATAIANAENEYMKAFDGSDIYGDAGFDLIQGVGEKYWKTDSVDWKSDLSWIRNTGDLDLEWAGYADVASSDMSGRRALWICREKGSDSVVAIVRGTVQDGKVTSMKFDATSRYSDMMSAEGTKRNVMSLVESLSASEPYDGRVATEEERVSIAESRAKLRERAGAEIRGDENGSDAS